MSLKTLSAALLALAALAGCGPVAGVTGSKADAVKTGATAPLPCDLYAAGGTPCVAAHSTTRALYASYGGRLYQVKRASDGAAADISAVGAGGYADSAAQDSFCAGTSCVISEIYDQSGHHNDLTPGPAGQQGPADSPADAAALPVTIGGHKVYGVYISPGTGYRNDATTGVATGDQPEGMYSVFGGTYYDSGCCFDYGNAETGNDDPGDGHMEALYFGTANARAGAGSGPWIAADLENGLFTQGDRGTNPSDPSLDVPFVTAVLKGRPGTWALRGGNARSGGLSTFYSGPRPAPDYDPMSREGAIILGIGGDNSQKSAGAFFEGAMTSGYPSDATEDAVQASITAAAYSS